jgi:hypothetical protein
VSEGLDAPQTAAQARTALEASRSATANANYGAARQSAGAVDVTPAIQAADDFLRPGARGLMSPQSNIADDSVEAAVAKARRFLTDGKSNVSDFDTAFRAKMELDAMIERASPTVQRQLITIRNALDDALASSSQPFATARDTFRQQSQAIEAVDQGTASASSRMRAEDTIPQFQGMRPDQQAGFRSGYADPLIARIDAASMSGTTNKARPLLTGKAGKELPAFAAPGRADPLMRRIGREDRMFETSNAVLGGSRTADNLADMGEIGTIDATVIGNLLSGNLKQAALQGIAKGAAGLQGRNTQTRDLIAQILMERGPTEAKQQLASAVSRSQMAEATKRKVIAAILGANASMANAQ